MPDYSKPQRGREKMAGLPPAKRPVPTAPLRKPSWIRVPAPDVRAVKLKNLLREQRLHTVCEEASCPNLGECFGKGTATFMILGKLCTRRCPFCDVSHGYPTAPDAGEPDHLAEAVARMELSYVVITSVNRDDLPDGGAAHFAACIHAVQTRCPDVRIEVLTPDFKKCQERALDILNAAPPHVFNHNLETVPSLYRTARPGANYEGSLRLIRSAKKKFGEAVPTKSGLMLGLGETLDEVQEVLRDLRAHDCDMVTLGQYLQPSRYHLPVHRYWAPDEFNDLGLYASKIGFRHVASAPLVRSSYHADQQSSFSEKRANA